MKKRFHSWQKKTQERPWFLSLLAIFGFLFLTLFLFLFFVLQVWKPHPFAPLLEAAPEVTEQQKILVLLQNEGELRPSGGFLSAVAVVEFQNQALQIHDILDSYSITPPKAIIPAPDPITTAFEADTTFRGWVFRDSNFFPDFPTSVDKVHEFLTHDERFADQEFDMTCAVNVAAIEDLLGAIGKGDENLYSKLQYETKAIDLHSIEELENRKGILSKLAEELQSNIGPSTLLPAMKSLLLSVQKKDIQCVHHTHDELQEFFHAEGWDGALPEEDFFAISVANLGAKKSDRYLHKSYISEIFVDRNGVMTETLVINMDHYGQDNILSGEGLYSINIMRPKGTRYWSEDPVVIEEENYSSLMLERRIDPGLQQYTREGDIAKIEITLPWIWSEGETKDFHWVQQSGTEAPLLLVFRSEGERGFTGEGCERHEEVSFCETRLDQDRKFSITLEPDTQPPFFENVLFQNEQEIFLRFSEDVTLVKPLGMTCPDEGSYQVEEVIRNPEEERDATFVLTSPKELNGDFCELRVQVTDLFENTAERVMTLPARPKP